MSKKIKIGLVGLGHLGKIHFELIRQINYFVLIGIYDIDLKRAKSFAKKFNVKKYKNLEKLILESDAIDIVTPTDTHFNIASKCLKLNKHIFIEKPLTKTLREGQKLIDLIKNKKIVAQVGHIERFNPAFKSVNSLITNPLFIESHRLAEFNPRGTDVSVVLDLMIHDIDIILTLIDSKIKTISGVGVPVISKTPDIANVRIEFENRAVVNLTASRISLKNMRKTRIFQKDTYISINYLNKEVEVLKIKNAPKKPNEYDMILENAEGVKKQILLKTPKIHDSNPIKEELSLFAESIINNTKPLVSLESGLNALNVAHQIINSFK